MSNAARESGAADDLVFRAQKPSVVDFLLGGPKLSDADADLLADRNKDFGRAVKTPE
jgi:hypothetical protein